MASSGVIGSAAQRNQSRSDLPRLLYVADVPIENFMHGSALMYRLLESYPAEKLLIVETLGESQRDRRLPEVTYKRVAHPIYRFLRSRFWPLFTNLFALKGGVSPGALEAQVGDFRPQAVLTVVHGYHWMTAAAFAKRHGLPLHLIAHDRWQGTIEVASIVKAWLGTRFASAYRSAASRFCVSPQMVDVYQRETGVSAEVLYPARRSGYVAPSTVSSRVSRPGQPFTIAYAGSIPGRGTFEMLELARSRLEDLGGRLLIFGPLSQEQLASGGLAGKNLIVGGAVAPLELSSRLRQDADALIASVSFDQVDLPAMEICFPSKLTEYTAAGLPILVHGPPSCSAVRWARENPGVAAIVDSEDGGVLTEALSNLVADVQWREALARTALRVGDLQFGADKAERALFGALLASHSEPHILEKH
jgi:hypothetical protein